MGRFTILAGVTGVLIGLMLVTSSHAEINHTNRDIQNPLKTRSFKENTVKQPATQSAEVTTVAYATSSKLGFGVDIKDYTATEEILQMVPPETSEDTVELKAGFTYDAGNHSNARFYLNYSMLGATIHPALQDKSSQKNYYMDQQAKLGIQLQF